MTDPALKIASYDLETWLSERGQFFPAIASVSLAEPRTEPLIGLADDAIRWFLELIEDPDRIVVGTFLAYDIPCVLEAVKAYPHLVRRIFDALKRGQFIGIDICQDLLDIADGTLAKHLGEREDDGGGGSHSLTSVCTLQDVPLPIKDESWRLNYRELARVAPEHWPIEARQYILDDATKPLACIQNQLVKNEAYPYPVLHRAGEETWSQVSLHLTAAHGVRVCPKRHAIVAGAVARHVEVLKQQLQVAGLVRADGSKDTKAAAARMQEVCAATGRPVIMTEAARNRKSLKPFAPKVSLEKDSCFLSGDEILGLYSEYSSTAGNMSARVGDLGEGFHLPIQTSFRAMVSTSRTGSRKPKAPHKGVQQQNHHRGPVTWKIQHPVTGEQIKVDFNLGMRETYHPRPECSFLWADFEAAEMHTLAQSCKDEVGYSKLGDLLNDDVDPHAYFGGIAFMGGLTAEEVMKHPDKKLIRNKAKPVNFGKPGGMGHEKWILFARKQYGQVFTHAEAKHFGNLWFQLFPECRDLHTIVKRALGGHETCTIRLPRGGLVGGGKRFTAACNFYFQAPCAMGAKASLNQVLFECYADPDSPLYGFRAFNMVHDEICLEGPTERVHAAGQRLRAIMVECFNIYTPDYLTGVEVIAGNAWSKEAEPCHNEKGELIPWIYETSKSYKKRAEALETVDQLLLAA